MKRQHVYFCSESQKMTINNFIGILNDQGITVIQLIYNGNVDGFDQYIILTEQ